MTKTLAEWQQGMPADLKAKHDAMSKDAALRAAEDLRNAAMQADYFGNTCPMRGPDRLAQAGNDFYRRADYFEALAASKPDFATSETERLRLEAQKDKHD